MVFTPLQTSLHPAKLWTAVAERSGDTAFPRAERERTDSNLVRTKAACPDASRREAIPFFQDSGRCTLERFKKFWSHSESGILTFGEALAKESRPLGITEPKRSQKSKGPASLAIPPGGYSIS